MGCISATSLLARRKLCTLMVSATVAEVEKPEEQHCEDSTVMNPELQVKLPSPKLTWKLTESPIWRTVVLKRFPLYFHVNLEECMLRSSLRDHLVTGPAGLVWRSDFQETDDQPGWEDSAPIHIACQARAIPNQRHVPMDKYSYKQEMPRLNNLSWLTSILRIFWFHILNRGQYIYSEQTSTSYCQSFRPLCYEHLGSVPSRGGADRPLVAEAEPWIPLLAGIVYVSFLRFPPIWASLALALTGTFMYDWRSTIKLLGTRFY